MALVTVEKVLFYDLFDNKEFNILAFTENFWLSRYYFVLTEKWKKEKKLLKINFVKSREIDTWNFRAIFHEKLKVHS